MAAMASRRESAHSSRLSVRPVHSRCVGRHHGTPPLGPRRVPGWRSAASRPGFGSFFVGPPARTLGFYLFKRYLHSPGYAFFFSTTCNANSGALWAKLGACAVPNSDVEYVLPLKLDVMLPFFLAGRTSSSLAAELARLVGRCANPVLQLLARQSAELTVEPCRDWEKLAELFRRHRSAHRITTDRSTVFLQWRYGPSSHNHPFDICVFRDKLGNEGWFSLGSIIREPQTIRGRVLLDAIWPRKG